MLCLHTFLRLFTASLNFGEALEFDVRSYTD